MSWIEITAVLAALLVLASVLGVLAQRRNGRVRRSGVLRVRSHELTAEDGVEPRFGRSATLVQFSTEFCARCPATRRLLGELADARSGVAHVDVDITRRKDIADRFGITQTPTILLLDATGITRARIGGAPQRAVVTAELDRLIGSHHD
ncbi:thioredoxin family protein [Microbacteriaceae bacterium VKM Ac-2855]|nr:thioredoxin family protein [Microbacteriaceae bacterium VKM Ac-2855]